MSSISPAAAGFRLIFRCPSISFAEIAWRWSFALATWFLGVMFFAEYMDTLPVKSLDRLMLGTHQPVLVLHALRRIFGGSEFRFTKAALLLVVLLTIAWIVLAALGRAATLKAMIEELGIARSWTDFGRGVFSSLTGLNFLRAAVTWAAAVCVVGAVLVSNSVWASSKASGEDAARLWFALLITTAMAWALLNWLLSTAAVFAMAEQIDALAAIAATVRVIWRQPGQFLAVLTLFGSLHGAVFAAAGGVGLTVLGMTGAVGARSVLFVELLIALLYFAVVDSLHVGRLAACLAIIRGEELAQLAQPGDIPPSRPVLEQGAIDASELILSDAPLPAN